MPTKIDRSEPLLVNGLQAANMLGISAMTLLRLRTAGEIPFVTIKGGKKGIRYSVADLREWIADRSTRER